MEAESGTPPESRFGERVKTCRKFYDLSVDALARLTREYDDRGISATALHRYETGDALPGARELRLLCQCLDVPSEWLIFGAAAVEEVSPYERALIEGLRGMIARGVALQAETAESVQRSVIQDMILTRRVEAMERARRRSTASE